jgi:hypothetical protein
MGEREWDNLEREGNGIIWREGNGIIWRERGMG